MLGVKNISFLLLAAFVVIAQVSYAGAPAYEVLKLRTIEVRRCEPVTAENVALVSDLVKAPYPRAWGRVDPAEIAKSVPGHLVEGVVRRRRDLSFPYLFLGGYPKPLEDTGWAAGDKSQSVFYFLSDRDQLGCGQFVPGRFVNIVVLTKSGLGCDTYPPAGICAFNYPIRVAAKATWDRFKK
jgi:hypothetical protein